MSRQGLRRQRHRRPRICLGLQDVIRDQLRTYTVTMIGGMTALTAVFAALLAFIA